MGNYIENLENDHKAELEKIRGQQEAGQQNLHIDKAEIERLAKLDAFHYDLEKRKLEAKIRSNKQLSNSEMRLVHYLFFNNK